MSDADRLFVAVILLVAIYLFRTWENRRRRYMAMMAAHCACVELARTVMQDGKYSEAAVLVDRMGDVEKGLGIRE